MSGNTVTLGRLGTSQTTTTYRMFSESGAVSSSVQISKRVPISIPETELYYWTRQWQTDEAQAVAEIENGLGQRFENSTDAIRWLLDADA